MKDLNTILSSNPQIRGINNFTHNIIGEKLRGMIDAGNNQIYESNEGIITPYISNMSKCLQSHENTLFALASSFIGDCSIDIASMGTELNTLRSHKSRPNEEIGECALRTAMRIENSATNREKRINVLLEGINKRKMEIQKIDEMLKMHLEASDSIANAHLHKYFSGIMKKTKIKEYPKEFKININQDYEDYRTKVIKLADEFLVEVKS
jgi:hypothetical protein